MYYKEFKFDELLKHLGRGDSIAFMSDEKKYSRNSKVVMIGTNNDYTKVTGKELSAIFVDTRYSNSFTVDTLHYLLTKVKGKVTELFPEKVYFTSNIMSDEYTFCGKLNLYEN